MMHKPAWFFIAAITVLTGWQLPAAIAGPENLKLVDLGFQPNSIFGVSNTETGMIVLVRFETDKMAFIDPDAAETPIKNVMPAKLTPGTLMTAKCWGPRAKNPRKTDQWIAIKDQRKTQDPLPDAILSECGDTLDAAYLAKPTGRYEHGVLGDAIEAGALTAARDKAAPVTFVLPDTQVFEDRIARISDAKSSGVYDSIVVVETALNAGASLSVFDLESNALRRIAQTPFIGLSNRWLNPAEIADFDGDGRHEIALVKTPHIGGTLEMWELRGSDEAGWNLVLEDALHGFSNHAYGSPIQDLSEAVDWNGDGIMDLALPGASRRSIRIMSFAGGKLTEIQNFPLPGSVITEVVSIRRQDGSIALLTGLDTRQLAIISTK